LDRWVKYVLYQNQSRREEFSGHLQLLVNLLQIEVASSWLAVCRINFFLESHGRRIAITNRNVFPIRLSLDVWSASIYVSATGIILTLRYLRKYALCGELLRKIAWLDDALLSVFKLWAIYWR
jgi:hypothetical protein